MAEVMFGTLEELDQLDGHQIISINGLEVGLFRSGKEIFAWENSCPHRGGPVCQGQIIPRVDEEIGVDGSSMGFRFSKDDLHIVCPWHGFEFNIRTGKHPGATEISLKNIKVRVVEGSICLEI